MNNNLDEALKLTSEIVNMHRDEVLNAAGVILFPPFVYLNPLARMVQGSRVQLGAQNCSEHDAGAYTGEVSAEMIRSCGGTYVIIGHSERRQYYGETNDVLAVKTIQCLKNGLVPVYCCGETLEERNAGRHFDVIRQQVSEGLFHLTAEEASRTIIAYEPVWAIGTGVTASKEQAQEVHAFIRGLLAEKYGRDVAGSISILYGGSVKPDNAAALFAEQDIDGGLIGGASLKSRDFMEIIKACGNGVSAV